MFSCEAMPDVIYMLDGLTDELGEILIPRFYDEVEPFSIQEEAHYDKLDFTVESFKRQLGCEHQFYSNKVIR